MFEKYKEKERLLDLADRKVYLVEFKFETTLGEEVKYTHWIRLDGLRSGLKSANELEFLDRTITIGDKSYNTKHIVRIDSKIIKEAYVKKSVKKKMDGYRWTDFSSWAFNKYHREDQLEDGEL